MAGLSYRRRIRVGSVGTAQSTPPLPKFSCFQAAVHKASFRRGFVRLASPDIGPKSFDFYAFRAYSRIYTYITE